MVKCLPCSLTFPVHSACAGGDCSCVHPGMEADPEEMLGELLDAVECIVLGVGTVEGRRIVRKVRAWTEQTESKLLSA